MGNYKLLIPIAIVAVSFFLYILSLLEVFPMLIAIPLLFGSVFLLVTIWNNRKRFKGFR